MQTESAYDGFVAEFERIKYLTQGDTAFIRKNYQAVLNPESATILALEIRQYAKAAGGDIEQQ